MPRILDGFEIAGDLYVEWLRQVRAPPGIAAGSCCSATRPGA
ncbi:hypothetical protein [Paractinoplanes hotanensis]|nr:hypothetical protein [Actinoplanes hotanensis]